MAVTEDTVTDLIASYLRDNGLNAVTQISETGPSGRDQPDLKVENGGLFYGEAKWESNKWEGFAEARDYGQEIAGTEGTFLIAYPDEIKSKGIQQSLNQNIADSLGTYDFSVAFLRRDSPTDIKKIPLKDLPNWIQDNIKQRGKPEADTDEVVDVLRQMARRLNEELQTAPEENLFRNVLGASTTDEEERQAARETAGFLLINQITFYKVLSHYFDEFDEIDADSLESPNDLGNYFEDVLEKDYTPVYQFRIADDLPESALSVVQDAVKSVNALQPENVNHDVLGKVFHELIPPEARKKVAAYYTKNQAADILTHLAIDDPDDTVIDPACGSGTLLAASYLRKRNLLEGDFNEDTHRRFIEKDITGIDVMPFAAHLSCIHLALQAPVYETDEVNIGIADSTSLKPGDVINPLSFVLPESEEQSGLADFTGDSSPDKEDRAVEGGSLNLDAEVGREMELTTKDLVIMNPPFSRQESVARFSTDYKDKLETRFDRRRKLLHGKMSYCSYFFFLADKFLESGGRIAAVVPSTVLNKKSDSGVRKMLVEEYDIEYIFAREDAANYSEDTDLREVLIIAKKGKSEDSSTAFVSHSGFDFDPSDVQTVAENMAGGETHYTDDFTVQKVSVEDLNIHNLFAPFSVTNPELFNTWETVVSGLELSTLDRLDTKIIRGIGSAGYGVMHVHPEASLNDSNAYRFGDRDHYVTKEEKDDAVVAKHRHTGDTFEVPRSDLVPNLRRYSGRATADLSDIPEYAILNDNWDGGDRYMALTDEANIPSEWSSRVRSRMGHTALVRRVNVTAPSAKHLAFYSSEKRLFPDMMWVLPNVTDERGKLLTAWFDSTFGWLQSIFNRIETEGGWIEWHKYVLKEFKVPTLNGFNEKDGEDRETLLNAFDEVKHKPADSLVYQLGQCAPESEFSDKELEKVEEAYDDLRDQIGDGFDPRRTLDKAVLDISGMKESDQDGFLDKFYADMLREIVSLKLMMGS